MKYLLRLRLPASLPNVVRAVRRLIFSEDNDVLRFSSDTPTTKKARSSAADCQSEEDNIIERPRAGIREIKQSSQA
jgi:hypothetical protein